MTEPVATSARRQPRRWIGRLAEMSIAFVGGGIVTIAVLAVVNGQLPFPVPTPTPTPTLTPLAIPGNAWATSTETALPVSVTPPGSLLTLGTPGQVEVALGDGQRALLSVVPDAPTLAPEADQAVLARAVPQLAGMSVYYYTVRVTKVAGAPVAGAELAPLFDAVTADAKPVQRFTIVDWRKCAGGATPAQVDELGTQVSLCFAAAVPTSGLIPAGVRFSQSGGPYDVSAGTAVSWMPN